MALQHPRPSSLHCRCRMAEDRPHATEPCPRSSGQAHGQQACPELRLTGKRPLCRRFNSTTRGPTLSRSREWAHPVGKVVFNSMEDGGCCCGVVGWTNTKAGAAAAARKQVVEAAEAPILACG